MQGVQVLFPPTQRLVLLRGRRGPRDQVRHILVQRHGRWLVQLHLQEHRRDRQEHPIGPFRDTGNRAFRHGPKAYGYNVGSCQKACKDYKYFALQHNGWCSCENDLQHATKYGTSSCGFYGGGWCNYIFRNDDLPSGKAPTLLAADDVRAYTMGTKNYAQIALDCRKRGGYMATGEQILEHLKFKARHPGQDSWTPYRTAPLVQVTSGMPAKNVTEAECRQFANTQSLFKGCYKDCSGRDLPSHQGSLTLEQCRAKAVQHNKKYFGLQYHNGISRGNKSTTKSECWIGDTFGNQGTRDNCYKVNDGTVVGAGCSNAVYQVPNYAAQTYEDNKVPEGCWMESNGNVRYNKGKSNKPCGHVSLNNMVPVRYVRIKASDWMNFSQVTVKDNAGNNLSKNKPCSSDGSYAGGRAPCRNTFGWSPGNEGVA